MHKRISSHANTYVIKENRRKGTVTVRTTSGIHVATMRRSAAIRDGLIEAHGDPRIGTPQWGGQMKSMKPTQTRAPAKAKGAKRRETKSQSFNHLASAPAEHVVERDSKSSRVEASERSWGEAFHKASRGGPTSR